MAHVPVSVEESEKNDNDMGWEEGYLENKVLFSDQSYVHRVKGSVLSTLPKAIFLVNRKPNIYNFRVLKIHRKRSK